MLQLRKDLFQLSRHKQLRFLDEVKSLHSIYVLQRRHCRGTNRSFAHRLLWLGDCTLCNYTSTFSSGMSPSDGCRIESHTVMMAVWQVQTEPPLHAWCHKPAALEHNHSQATAGRHFLHPILPVEEGRQNTYTEPHQLVALRQQGDHYFDSLTGIDSLINKSIFKICIM